MVLIIWLPQIDRHDRAVKNNRKHDADLLFRPIRTVPLRSYTWDNGIMTSLNTNIAAMTALQTLQSTNSSMESTQNRIATGYRVNSASDNAAYWSIATTMRSDKSALSSVVDALGIGSATVDTAYTAMETTKDLLNDIKSKLTTATGENVDKGKVQGEIKALQDTIKSIAGSASFSGENFLSVDGASKRSVIGSFARTASGSVSLGSIQIDTSKTALFNSNATQYGLLEKGADMATKGGIADASQTATGANAATAKFAYAAAQDVTFKQGDVISFDFNLNGTSKKITIDKALVDSTSITDSAINSVTDLETVVKKALANEGFKVGAAATDDLNVAVSGSDLVFTSKKNVADGGDVSVSGTKSTTNGVLADVASFDISKATRADIDFHLKNVDKVIGKVIDAAATLGASKNQIDMQSDFTSKLMNTIDKGIGTLVDADMTEESTKLKALQTQQQLGVQALSMANSSSQSLLSLFR